MGIGGAISIPDDLFADAERLAKALRMSRSRLYSRAIKEYVARHAPDEVTRSLVFEGRSSWCRAGSTRCPAADNVDPARRRSCVEAFEATARSLTGHRSLTMIDNAHIFLALTAIQCSAAVAVLARRSKLQRDPLAYAIGALLCVNALLAAHWPWWGSQGRRLLGAARSLR